MSYPWHLYAMAVMYMVAGIFHFLRPKMYMRIMPRYLPNHKTLVYLSGIAEIVLGIAICVPKLKNYAIFGIIVMLTGLLMVHFYMLSGKQASVGIPKWILLLRIPLQFFLMYWAYWYLQF